MDFQTRN